MLPRPDGGEFVATPDSDVPEMSCTSEENAEGSAGSYRRCGEDAVLLPASTTFDHNLPGSGHAARESIVLSNQHVVDRNGPYYLRCRCGFSGLDSISYYGSDSDSEGLGGRTAGSAAGVGDPFRAQPRYATGKAGGVSDRDHAQ